MSELGRFVAINGRWLLLGLVLLAALAGPLFWRHQHWKKPRKKSRPLIPEDGESLTVDYSALALECEPWSRT